MKPPQTYHPPQRIAHLFAACEKACVKDCCGIGAFDFSPLNVASYIAAYKGDVSASDIADWHAELERFESEASVLPPNEFGWVCAIDELGDSFCAKGIRDLTAQLKHCVSVTPQICQLSRELASPISIWETHRATSDRIRLLLEKNQQAPK